MQIWPVITSHRPLFAALHIKNSEQSSYLLIDLDTFSPVIKIYCFISILQKQEYIIYYQPSRKERIKLMFTVHYPKLFRMD